VWSGGFASGTTVNGKDSFDFVVGKTFSDVINNGTEFVVSGGFASGTTVNSGGVEAVYNSGSEAASITINVGGAEVVSGGGLDVGALVAGLQFVMAGGTASGADVRSGAAQVVGSGGSAIATSVDGGLMEVASGGSTGSAPVSFTKNGGDLQLDFSQSFTGTVAGFASPPGVTEEIDLRDIVFTSATTVNFTEAANNTSGTLTVTDGTHIANLTLLGQYTAANFSLSSDGNGGTLIKDPVGSAASPVLAAHG
jgi:autotransporter passenger strand-loop-strand repeat protein